MTDLVPLTKLHHHPDNPPGRHTDVDELADSIRAVGILQPLLVEPDGDGYIVVAGNRRLAAAHLAELAAAPCVIRPTHDRNSHTEVRLIENGHRKNLTPMEQARAFEQLRDAGLTQAQISKRTGFSTGQVSDRLALLHLDEATQARVAAGTITVERAVNAVRAVRNQATRDAKHGRAKTSEPVSVGEPGGLNQSNPVASAAHTRCRTRHGLAGGLVGQVACGICWEHAIRADERWQIEEGDSPAEPTPVTEDIDVEILARRAIRGEALSLSARERRAVAQWLRDHGRSAQQVADIIGQSQRNVFRLAKANAS